MDIAVVGAGIVGLSTAYWLAKAGHRVTVVERHPLVGQGASYANGGQLSYSYVAPFASASVLPKLPAWLLDSNGPVRFRPSLRPAEWLWIAGFLRACTSGAARKTTKLLLELADYSRHCLHEMMRDAQLSFEHQRNGKLVFYSSKASMAGAVAQMKLQAELGCKQTALTASECIVCEPALRSVAGRLEGGIFTESDETGDCRRLCEELQRLLTGPRYNASFALSCTVESMVHAQDRIIGLRTSRGIIEADLYVVCSGLESRSMLQAVGEDIPLHPIAGYSISPRIVDREAAPQHSVTDYERKIVYAPLGAELRVAGFADLSRSTESDGARLIALSEEVQEVFPGACSLERVRPWVGLRPATPGGSPIVGPTRYSNMLINLGHGGLGFTLAAGSGRLIANMVAER
jgi:D-amino-acid dehydrogenase